MAVKKENMRKGSGFFRQQHDQNKEDMKKKNTIAHKTRNKTIKKGWDKRRKD